MRKYCLLLLLAISLVSCDDSGVTVQDSIGRLNDIMVVIENEDWEGALGDSIRKEFARPILGIVREEPLFTLNHVKPSAFKGILTKSRNYLWVKKDQDTSMVNVKKNAYANPQIGVVVRGTDAQDIADLITSNADDIIQVFNKGEVKRKQKLMERVALNTDRIQKSFGIDITFPRAYHYGIYKGEIKPDFYWLRRRIKEGTMDFMIYEVPFERIKRDSNTVKDIIKVRDSISAEKILVDEPGVFQTEPIFTPYLNESQIDGRFAFETKGTWEVKNKFMAGPFVNYAIYNKDRNTWLMIEGYVSAPNSVQRDYLFEIESILKSVDFIESNDTEDKADKD
ncbi:DUF4837 family protein [Nonlabens xiamenensis]|uniref:DUF4837 family protein n=1 Tax=Nonlabens xiamenensis TaxID=2341043 RepID=UPI000F60B57A|nr:DUF4837 family protein [Nonlabens xiamenensis]